MPSKTVQIPTPDGRADAFAAFPDDGQRHPGVLMYMDAFGLRPVLEEMARELAGHGFYVLVPNVYYRHGPAPVFDLPEYIDEKSRPAIFEKIMPLLQGHTADLIQRDAGAFLDFLTAQPEVSAGPVGVTGYCMGGALALRTATAYPDRVAAVAGFHPAALVTEAPDSPHRSVPELTARVHFGLAEGDMTPEAIEELDLALDVAGVDHSIEVYPGTIHGFTMSDTGAFNAEGKQHHWDRMLPVLKGALTGS